MKLDSLQKLYVEELRDLYSAENQILKALPKMQKAASDKQLQRAFAQHERVTRKHVQRLDRRKLRIVRLNRIDVSLHDRQVRRLRSWRGGRLGSRFGNLNDAGR